MNLLPKTYKEFSHKDYWDSFFKKRGNKTFEWYGEYPELAEHLHKYVKLQDNVLIIGCGNSTLGHDLCDVGYKKVTNIDISDVVIKQMSQNGKSIPNLKYLLMDAFDMTFENEEFSVAIDKGTLDGLINDDKRESLIHIYQYFKEIERVLKTGGRYICISLLQEHILNAILSYFPQNNWMVRVVRCFEVEKNAIENKENSMPIFAVVCTKFKSLPTKILELCLTASDNRERVDTTQDVLSSVRSVQQAAFVCSGLRQTDIVNEQEVYLDLYEPGKDCPRFTVHVVDVPSSTNNPHYAAFVVPQGREAEWLFSTRAGRKHLVKMAKHNRLAIITMHRGNEYESLDSVQNELSDVICNLAPPGFTAKKIPFLSLGSDVGHRDVRHRGHSKYSGDYVVEDVQMDNGQKFRRLYYLSSQLVIQSEARLRTAKSRRGLVKELIDLTYLTCCHHIYMTLGTFVACHGTVAQPPSVVVLGLGGGGLCSFLHKFMPSVHILGVDIDEEMLVMARQWFGLQEDANLSTQIIDGVVFLKEAANREETINAVLFDIDSKDSSIGMSCPPKQFLEDEVLNNVAKVIGKTGLFIVNIVLRDESLRPSVVDKLKENFKTIFAYKLEEDLNEIFICKVAKVKNEELLKSLTNACTELNIFFKKQTSNIEHINTEKFITSIKINS